MLINRHNYEEFFLMYVDNELNMHQRIEVELFVEQHPDLAAELNALQEAVLLPEPDITFTHKNSLYKQEKEGITKDNCEEQFLLYIDNELSAEARSEVEAFVQQNPEQQAQLNLLQQTVLAPEPIVFANKKVLYRKEKERRVIPMAWSRLAVAAALLGVTATTGWWFFHTEEKGNAGVAVVADIPSHSNTPQRLSNYDSITAEKLAKTQQEQSTTAQANTATLNTTSDNTVPAPVTDKKYMAAATMQNKTAVNTTVAPAPTAQSTARPVIAELVTLPAGNEAGIVRQPATQVPVTSAIPLAKTDIPPAAAAPQTAAQVNIINDTHKTIAYKELDTSEDDQSLYVGSLELNRNKVKGFLRKAGRALGARAKVVREENL